MLEVGAPGAAGPPGPDPSQPRTTGGGQPAMETARWRSNRKWHASLRLLSSPLRTLAACTSSASIDHAKNRSGRSTQVSQSIRDNPSHPNSAARERLARYILHAPSSQERMIYYTGISNAADCHSFCHRGRQFFLTCSHKRTTDCNLQLYRWS